MRWTIAVLVGAAIAISYLDRQTLPVAIKTIGAEIPISSEVKAFLDTAFLATYGLMYLVGGRLMDMLGTRSGFIIIMVFWSLACASHGLAFGVGMLAASRLLLGVGEGGGFPAATRAVAAWFPAHERATAMGIVNAGTAIGGIVAPPLIAAIILHIGWRWVFFLTGGVGLLWTLWWWFTYREPTESNVSVNEPPVPIAHLFRFRATWALVFAKFLSDAAWYFYLFWLPKFLQEQFHFDIKAVGSVAWIPHAAAGVGCLLGGGLSSWLLKRGRSVGLARKLALGLSAAVMPCVILVPHVPVAWAVALMSVGYFGQQSWSTLVMILPTDMFPRRAIGTIAGLVGMGGAMGGICFGQWSGWMLDHGSGYGPVFAAAGVLHVAAFVLICLVIPKIQPLNIPSMRTQI